MTDSPLAAAERLEEEIKAAIDDEGYGPSRGDIHRMLTQSADTLSRLRALLGQSQEALKKFGQHHYNCGVRTCAKCGMRATYDSVPAHYDKSNPAHHEVVSGPCDCGLEVARASSGRQE